MRAIKKGADRAIEIESENAKESENNNEEETAEDAKEPEEYESSTATDEQYDEDERDEEKVQGEQSDDEDEQCNEKETNATMIVDINSTETLIKATKKDVLRENGVYGVGSETAILTGENKKVTFEVTDADGETQTTEIVATCAAMDEDLIIGDDDVEQLQKIGTDRRAVVNGI